ncbi:hypothetical protein FA13DRAFT_1728845 [Coprinellus micaceus]|uniref:Uncharacterized protein n=1 Tax=Coprinellus micaceus TaxID=71717 RepID=A0A4Y7TLJ6_COPMI|nr:hypothetical protein FA13DRAFT_1728845 [Coprinellus micaceus]
MHTPGLVRGSAIDANPAYIIAHIANEVVVSILAQRLLIDMRKIDYMGSQPVASKLLFAPPEPGSEGDLDSFETTPEPSSSLFHRNFARASEGSAAPCTSEFSRTPAELTA